MAQLGPTVGVVKPGGGMNTWKRPLLPSGKLSRPDRLIKALGHHTMQPNTMPDKGQLPQSQADWAGHESPGEDCDGLIRHLVSIHDSQFGFVPGRGTTDAIFVVRQLQEKYLTANKRLYMAFVDLEKAFDRVPQKVIWWVLRKLGVEERIVRLVQGMYANARICIHVGEGYSEESEAQYSARFSTSLCLKPYHESSALGSPGRTSMTMTLLSLPNPSRNVSGGSWFGKKQWKRKDWA